MAGSCEFTLSVFREATEPGLEELGLKEDIISVITESDGDESMGLKGHTNSLITESDGDELWDLKRT